MMRLARWPSLKNTARPVLRREPKSDTTPKASPRHPHTLRRLSERLLIEQAMRQKGKLVPEGEIARAYWPETLKEDAAPNGKPRRRDMRTPLKSSEKSRLLRELSFDVEG